jgi:phosphate/sulfate permease
MATYDLMIWNVVMFCSVCLIVAIVLVLIIREKTLYPLNEERIIIVEKIKKPETVNNNNQDIYSVIDTYV